MLLNHISIIVSSEDGIEFYKKLGFIEKSRVNRPESHDELIYLFDGLNTLEIYKDSTHPKRLSKPEAYGLRHLCFEIERIEQFANSWNVELKQDTKGRFCFINDPDGQPIEIRERILKYPEDIE